MVFNLAGDALDYSSDFINKHLNISAESARGLAAAFSKHKINIGENVFFDSTSEKVLIIHPQKGDKYLENANDYKSIDAILDLIDSTTVPEETLDVFDWIDPAEVIHGGEGQDELISNTSGDTIAGVATREIAFGDELLAVGKDLFGLLKASPEGTIAQILQGLVLGEGLDQTILSVAQGLAEHAAALYADDLVFNSTTVRLNIE